MIYNILDYGALPDGETVNTKAIQNAIDDCAVTGGRVLIPAGRFVTGSLQLKSHVDLHLEQDALLLASHNLEDYNALDAFPQNRGCANEGWDGKHLIWCAEEEDVSITGLGAIDGAGDYFFDEPKLEFPGYGWRFGSTLQKPCFEARPGQLIVFCESNLVRVQDIRIRNATCWALYFHGCEDVQVRGVNIKNPNYHLNTDGIDIDACRFVTVSDCIIDTGDDAMTFRCSALNRLKGKHDVCEYVTVTNCILSSASSCFRIGVGTGTIQHIKVSDIIIKCSGIAIHFNSEWSTSSTPTYDVSFDNVSAIDTGNLLAVTSARTPVSGISIKNVYAECESVVVIKSESEELVNNVTLRDFLIKPIWFDVQKRMDFFSVKNVGNLICDKLRTVEGKVIE